MDKVGGLDEYLIRLDPKKIEVTRTRTIRNAIIRAVQDDTTPSLSNISIPKE